MLEKTYDKPMKGESSKSFEKFTIYRDLSPDIRSIKKVAEIILDKDGIGKDREEYNLKFKRMEKSLEGLSLRWFWVERTLINDSERLIQEQKEHEREFKEVNRDLIDSFKMVINFSKKRLIDLNEEVVCKANGEKYSPLSLVKMAQDITTTLKTANEQIRLCFGLSTTNDNININANVNSEVELTGELSVEDRRERNEDYIREFIEGR